MAKEKKQREPGRIAQMVQVYKTTKEHDRSLPITLLLWFILPIVVAIAIAAIFNPTVVGWIVWPLTGVLVGILAAMIVLGRRAERVAYTQIEGRPGAVGAILSGALRRSYRGSEVPVAVSPRSQDAVYRAVGRAGIVLVAEGAPSRTARLMQDEERKVKRALPNVPVHKIFVGRETADQVPLPKLPQTIYRLKGSLRRNEIQAVHQRLASLQANPIGLPKGIDPNRVRRPARPR